MSIAKRLFALSRVRAVKKPDVAALTPLFKDIWNIDYKETDPYTKDLQFLSSTDGPAQPMFSVLQQDGTVLGGAHEAESLWDEATARKSLTTMLRLRVIDNVMYDAQRQGRISFYLTSTMEEATQIGMAAGLSDTDDLFPQYREFGLLLWRGFTIDQMLSQHMGNIEDAGKGRQMPVHYGSPEHHWHTVSSPLATQLPHAAGFGYAARLNHELHGEKQGISVALFGDGSASEGDFHAALNFASVHRSYTLFACRNNGFAISTPCHDQYAGDGIAARGRAYGVATARVDGFDILAVRYAVAQARKYILENGKPAMIEFLTYRGGHHSTSDDASRYRGDVSKSWAMSLGPISRAEQYFIKKGWWTQEESETIKKETRKTLVQRIEHHEQLGILPPEQLFDDVYAKVPESLQYQRRQLMEYLEREKRDPMPKVGKAI